MKKLDHHGHYQRFPGTTVICDVADSQGWFDFYKEVTSKKNFCKYFAPLPSTSYHITVRGIKTAARDFKSEQEFFDDILMHFSSHADVVREMLAKEAFAPVVELKDPHVSISAENVALIYVLPRTHDNERHLYQLISNIEKQMRIDPELTRMPLHLTLAYRYSEGFEYDKDAKKELLELRQTLLEWLASGKITLNLKPARLCYFKDMTAFHPI